MLIRDLEELKEYKERAKDGDINAVAKVSDYYYAHKEYDEAVKWASQAAKEGHRRSQFNLGTSYLHGLGVEEDSKVAAKWFEKAAEKEHALAQYNLGVCYEEGKGVEADILKAKELYQKALDNNLDYAHIRLDRVNEFLELKEKAEKGDAEAQYKCGECYERGEGVKFDLEEALYWFKKSAKQDYDKAKEAMEYYFN